MDDIRPKKRWYWIGGGLMAFSVVAAIAALVLSLMQIGRMVDDFDRVEPGQTVTLDLEAGKSVIYAEGIVSLSFYPDVEVIDPDGTSIPVQVYIGDLNYSFDNNSGRAIGTFEAPSDGRYTIINSEIRPIAIGSSIGRWLVIAIASPFIVGGVLFLLGLIILIVTMVRRGRANRALAAQYPPQHSYPEHRYPTGYQQPGQPGPYGQYGYQQPPQPPSTPPPPPPPSQ